jgi:RimJ/RimL family protein N-acetyltransferase
MQVNFKLLDTIGTDSRHKHYSIYTEELGYCGETGYGLEGNLYFLNGNCGIEIKLLPKANGKGIAEYSLRKIIDEMLMDNRKYITIWADPNKENIKAIKLYEKLGFQKKEFPDYLKDIGEDNGERYYLELKLSEYKKWK